MEAKQKAEATQMEAKQKAEAAQMEAEAAQMEAKQKAAAAKMKAKVKATQEELELVQSQRGVEDKTVRAKNLQRTLQYTNFLPNREHLENEERHIHVQTYVDNQSMFQSEQVRAPQPSTSPPRPSRQREESQRPDVLISQRVDVATTRSQDLPTVAAPLNPTNHTTDDNRMGPPTVATAPQQNQLPLGDEIGRT